MRVVLVVQVFLVFHPFFVYIHIILIKKDGYPTYNFAHIVDDAEMGVTHVMRGVEYLSSTPNYLELYDAFGLSRPVFVSFG